MMAGKSVALLKVRLGLCARGLENQIAGSSIAGSGFVQKSPAGGFGSTTLMHVIIIFMPAGLRDSDCPAEPDVPCRELVDLQTSPRLRVPTWKRGKSFLCWGKH